MQLIIIDVQDKILNSFGNRPEFLSNVRRVLSAFIERNWPVLVTEQVPNRLGPTNASLVEMWAGAPHLVRIASKSRFSAADDYHKLGIKANRVVLVGLETDICVLQTALELSASVPVTVITDAVTNGRLDEQELAFLRMRSNNVLCVTTEEFFKVLS